MDDRRTKLAPEFGERGQCLDGLLAGLRVPLAQQRQDHLLEQRRFALCGLTPSLEVTALDPEVHETGRGLSDGKVAGVVRGRVAAPLAGQQPEGFQLGELWLGEPGELAQVTGGEAVVTMVCGRSRAR